MATILILGKAGQLGRALERDVRRAGFNAEACNHAELDVTDALQFEKKLTAIRPDFVINATAYNHTKKCEDEPLPALAVNTVAVGRMAALCKTYGARFITYSTFYVFDGSASTPYREQDAVNPLQMYGISKAAGEYAAANYYREGTWIIRTGSLYGGGTGGSSVKGNFVLDILQKSRQSKVIEVSSEQVTNPTSADDLSKATLDLIAKNTASGIYHLVNEGYCTYHEFAREIVRIAQIGMSVIPVDRAGLDGPMRRPKFGALTADKSRMLGITMPDWRESLERYVRSCSELIA